MTLLELLIVIGLLLALLAFAMPITMRSLEARELESTEENIASELIKARVKAQESGRPVEVVVLDSPSRVVIRYFREDESGGRFSDDARTLSASDSASTRTIVDPVRDAWWEESELHPSISVATVPTADEVAATEPNDEKTAPGGAVRLAVYLPDGTTLFATSLLLMHQNGLRSSVSVDPWTGQPAIHRGGPASSQGPAAETPAAPEDDELSPAEAAEEFDELADFEPGDAGTGQR